MPKRFTDTEKWKKPFLRNLKAPYKLLWFYILDECDHAGIWQVDFEVARLKIGERVNEADAAKSLAEKFVSIDGGEKWFIPSFIEFQYGKLAENNRAHTKAIATLLKHGLLDENLNVRKIVFTKPLISPLQGAKVEVEVEEQEQELEEAQEQGAAPKKILTMPWCSDGFYQAWDNWKEYKKEVKKFKYASISTEQAALNTLTKLAEGKEENAIELIVYAIGRQWDGFYPISKADKNGQQTNSANGKQPTGANVDSKSAYSKIDALYGGT